MTLKCVQNYSSKNKNQVFNNLFKVQCSSKNLSSKWINFQLIIVQSIAGYFSSQTSQFQIDVAPFIPPLTDGHWSKA